MATQNLTLKAWGKMGEEEPAKTADSSAFPDKGMSFYVPLRQGTIIARRYGYA